jgi:hypothetical protein
MLQESDLQRTIARPKGRGSDHDCDLPFREVRWHLAEEALQHRGELNALLWQIEADVPVHSWTRWAHDVGRTKDLSPK